MWTHVMTTTSKVIKTIHKRTENFVGIKFTYILANKPIELGVIWLSRKVYDLLMIV